MKVDVVMTVDIIVDVEQRFFGLYFDIICVVLGVSDKLKKVNFLIKWIKVKSQSFCSAGVARIFQEGANFLVGPPKFV